MPIDIAYQCSACANREKIAKISTSHSLLGISTYSAINLKLKHNTRGKRTSRKLRKLILSCCVQEEKEETVLSEESCYKPSSNLQVSKLLNRNCSRIEIKNNFDFTVPSVWEIISQKYYLPSTKSGAKNERYTTLNPHFGKDAKVAQPYIPQLISRLRRSRIIE